MKTQAPLCLKLILLSTFLILFSGLANSQSFMLMDVNNVAINNGDTVFVYGDDMAVLESVVWIKNISTIGKNVKVRKTELNTVPGSACAMMWGVYDYAPSVQVTPFADFIGPQQVDPSFLSMYIASGNPGISWYRFVFFDENNQADSAWVIVQFGAWSAAGIEENQLKGISLYPNPGNGIFKLSFESALQNDFSAEVFNSTGSLIMTEDFRLSSPSHTFDLTRMPAGMYFLNVRDRSDDAFKTWKIMKSR